MRKVGVLNIGQFHEENTPEQFYASTLQHHLRTRHDIAVPHKHDFYLLVLFTKGTGIHEVDFTSYEVKPGALFMLNPGQTHYWELSENTEGYIFFHTQSFYDLHYTDNKLADFPFFFSQYNSPCIYLNNVKTQRLESLLKILLEEYSNPKLLNRQFLVSLADIIYTECTRAYMLQNPSTENSRDKYYDKFRRFEELVEKHFITEKSPAAFAVMLNITPKHLNRITQAVVAKTASDVIQERVMLEAKKLLVQQKDSFSEIGFLLGYEDYAYFSRLFKKKTGETPSVFLSRYKQGISTKTTNI